MICTVFIKSKDFLVATFHDPSHIKEKDSYNNEVTKKAGPLPIEYLIVDMPAAFAKDPTYAFNEGSPLLKTPFPIENRAEIGEIQVLELILLNECSLLDVWCCNLRSTKPCEKIKTCLYSPILAD